MQHTVKKRLQLKGDSLPWIRFQYRMFAKTVEYWDASECFTAIRPDVTVGGHSGIGNQSIRCHDWQVADDQRCVQEFCTQNIVVHYTTRKCNGRKMAFSINMKKTFRFSRVHSVPCDWGSTWEMTCSLQILCLCFNMSNNQVD